MRYLVIACGVLIAACGNTYHPEYHPVTVTQVSQDLSYPVSVHNGPSPTERAPVVIMQQPAAPPPVIQQAPPPGW